MRVERLYPLPEAGDLGRAGAATPAPTRSSGRREKAGEHRRLALHGPAAARRHRPGGRPGLAPGQLGARRRAAKTHAIEHAQLIEDALRQDG